MKKGSSPNRQIKKVVNNVMLCFGAPKMLFRWSGGDFPWLFCLIFKICFEFGMQVKRLSNPYFKFLDGVNSCFMSVLGEYYFIFYLNVFIETLQWVTVEFINFVDDLLTIHPVFKHALDLLSSLTDNSIQVYFHCMTLIMFFADIPLKFYMTWWYTTGLPVHSNIAIDDIRQFKYCDEG